MAQKIKEYYNKLWCEKGRTHNKDFARERAKCFVSNFLVNL